MLEKRDIIKVNCLIKALKIKALLAAPLIFNFFKKLGNKLSIDILYGISAAIIVHVIQAPNIEIKTEILIKIAPHFPTIASKI